MYLEMENDGDYSHLFMEGLNEFGESAVTVEEVKMILFQEIETRSSDVMSSMVIGNTKLVEQFKAQMELE